MEPKCHKFLAKQKFTSFLKYITLYILYIYYTQTHTSFSTTLDKGLRKNIKKKKTDEIGKYKLNEMGALNMK